MNHFSPELSDHLLHMMRGALAMLFVIMCIRLYPRRKENPILAALFWLLAVMPVLILISFGFTAETIKDKEYFHTLKILINLCLVPLIGSFFLKIIIPGRINIRKALLLIAPAAAFVFIHIITNSKIVLTLSYIYAALTATTVFILVVFVSKRYDRYLKDNFSNIDNMTVRWVRVVIYIFAAWNLVWGMTIKQNNRCIDLYYYLFLIIIWVFIYKYSIKHITAFRTQELFESPRTEAMPLPESEYARKKLGTTLELYVEQQRPWLNPTITLQELASGLGTNRTYLSEYFNKTQHTTFYDYLNSFRVKHACKLLLSENNLPITNVGEESGFNSLSTFRRAFKKHTGCSPAEYRNRNIIS